MTKKPSESGRKSISILIDQDETDFERYRQLRRLFQSKLPEYH